MYTRVVELTTKPEKARELCVAIDDKVLPILKKQPGFVDETVLASDIESNRVLALSFWNSKEDAERYHREQYPKINEMLAHLLDTASVIRTFDVHTSTTHRVAAGKAAQQQLAHTRGEPLSSTPTAMQSISENDFECFASTGVNAPETM